MNLCILILIIAINGGCSQKSAGTSDFHHNEGSSLVAKAAENKIEERFEATTADTSSSEMGTDSSVPSISARALSELIRSIDADSRVYQVQHDVAPTPMEFIEKARYSGENHYVVTPSGYILNLNRIPRGKTGKNPTRVAYLQHGLGDSTLSWLHDFNNALAYVLADAGYDVWMGNSRGNTYSRNHTTLDPDNDSEFWDFSWHEMGVEDLPTIIDYILDQTGTDGVYYVGHSQGTTAFYVMASTKPEMNSKIKVQVSLSPVGQLMHMKSPLLKISAKFRRLNQVIKRIFGIKEFLPHGGLLSSLAMSTCKEKPGPLFCTMAFEMVMGYSPDQRNISLLPAIVDYLPAGLSMKQIIHFQLIASKSFRQFDYGPLENLKRYGSISSPEYDLKKISTPVYLFYSTDDWLSSEKDVDILYGKLGNCIGRTLIDKPSFNHMDFMYGKFAPEMVYKKIVEIFSEY